MGGDHVTGGFNVKIRDGLVVIDVRKRWEVLCEEMKENWKNIFRPADTEENFKEVKKEIETAGKEGWQEWPTQP